MAKKKKRKSEIALAASQPRNDGITRPKGVDKGSESRLADTVVLYCLYALVGLLPLAFVYPTYDIFELTKVTVLRLITLTMLGAWSWKIFRDRSIRIATTPINWFVLTYILVFTLATVLSKNPRLSLLGDYGRFEGMLTILNYAAVFFMAGSLVKDNTAITDQRVFVKSLVFTAVTAADIVSAYGISQRFGFDFLVWSSAGTDLSRAFSTLGNPIYIAAYLTILLSIALAVFFAEERLWPRVFLGSSVALVFAALVFTFSRAGWAGFLLALIGMGALGIGVRRVQGVRRGNVLAVGVLIVAIVAVAGISLSVSSRAASSPTRSALERALSSFNLKSGGVGDRIYLWKSAVKMIKDRPVLGWGPETFGTYFPKYRSVDFVHYELDVLKRPKILFQNRPHSDILQTGTSAGVLGIAAYLALLGAYFWFALRKLSGANGFNQALLIGIIGGLAGYFAQIQFSFSTIAVSPIVWLLMAVTFVIGETGEVASLALPRRLAMTESHDSDEIITSQAKDAPCIDTYNWSLDRIPQPVLLGFVVVIVFVVLAGAFLSVRPLAADYYFDQGVNAMGFPDSFSAGEAFETAMDLNPYEPEYSNYAGNTFVEVAKASKDAGEAKSALTTAIDYLDKGIALNPDMPGYHFNMGNAKYYYSMLPNLDKDIAEKMMKEALGEYLFAVAADPNNPDIRFNLASAYMRFSQQKKAKSELKKGLDLNPNNDVAKKVLKKLEAEAD